MRLNILSAIYQKEMLDLVRDKRTLISMVAVPLLVFPLLLAGGSRVIAMLERKFEADAKSMGVAVRVTSPGVRECLRKAGLQLTEKDDLKGAVTSKTVSAAVEEVASEIRIYVDSANQTSAAAGDMIRTALTDLKEQKVKESLRGSGVPESVLTPFTISKINLAGEKKMAGMVWGSMLGYMLLLLMFTGGMYPAIDMTAGEKERKTLEAFISSPAQRGEIVLGKVLATMTSIFVTALLTLGSLVYSLKGGGNLSSNSKELQRMMSEIPLDAHTITLILVTLIPLAALAAAVMIAIALFARSFKEGQSYLTPIVLFVLFPALLGGLPGLELTPVLSLIPIFNASQLIRGILLNEFSASSFAVTMCANLVYAAIAFVIASRTFEDESVLFRS